MKRSRVICDDYQHGRLEMGIQKTENGYTVMHHMRHNNTAELLRLTPTY
jgi:hypothetical protein